MYGMTKEMFLFVGPLLLSLLLLLVCSSAPLLLTPLHTPKTPPFLHPYIYSAIFGKYQCFISLTISLGPDKAATV